MNKKTFLITTPIFYPTGNLHIGHVYTITMAWILKNFKLLMNYEAKLLTGADEHGQKVEQKANQLNLKPQEYVDMMDQKFKNLWFLLKIDYDYYSRTTSLEHKKAVQKQIAYFKKTNNIFKSFYKGLYSVQDEEFITNIQAVKKNNDFYHPVSNHKLINLEEEAYFLKISDHTNWLIDYIKNNPNFIKPQKIVHELMNNFIEKGLKDLSISRSNFNWGISFEKDSKHILYVWLDALFNYITTLGYNSANDKAYLKYWKNGDEVVHLIGKEISRFHSIYWPIVLKISNLRLPNTIFAHGWIIDHDGKISKSKKNNMDPKYFIEKYGAEELKYFLAASINLEEDGFFSELLLKRVINNDLVNSYGNLISRVIALIKQNFQKPVTFIDSENEDEKQFMNFIFQKTNLYVKSFNNFKIHLAFKETMLLIKYLNNYVDIHKPWNLKNNILKMEKVLNNLLNGIYAASIMLSVVLPNKTQKVFDVLEITKDFDLIKDFNKFDNVKIKKNIILFERIK